MTFAGVTSQPSTEYTPTVMMTSCSTAIIAASAIFGSRRHAR